MTKRIERTPNLAIALATALLLAPVGQVQAASGAVKKLKRAVGQLASLKGFIASDDKKLEQAKELVAEVAKQDDAEAAKLLLVVLQMPCQSASVEVNLSEFARDGLMELKSKGARDTVRKALKKGRKRYQIAIALSEIVGSWQDTASAEALGELLSAKDERILLAAARGLGKLHMKASIKALIDAFAKWQKKGGEPLEAIGGALWEITQLGLKTHKDWKKWWGNVGKDWKPSMRKSSSSGATRPRNYQKKKPPKLFESLEIKSRKIVIIMDVSGSMHIRQYVEEESKEKGSGGKGTSLGGGAPKLPKGDPNKDGYEKKKCTFNQCPGAKGTDPRGCPSDEHLPLYYRRINRLSRQVQKVVRSFNKKVRFNMVAYSSDARPWKGMKLVPASASNKDKAVKWLRGLQPSGSTRADKAIELGFRFKDADTFIFVTDGAPTNQAGKVYPSERWRELLDQVKRLNKLRKVRIDVIAIAEGSTAFASGLAEENRGEYVAVD